MSLAVNGKRVDLTQKENRHSKEVLDGISTIKRMFRFPLTFQFVNHKRNMVPLYRSTSQADLARPTRYKAKGVAAINVRYNETVPTMDGVTEQWQYFKSTVRDGDKERFLPESELQSGSWIVQDIDADLAFFLLFKSPYCANSLNPNIKQLGRQPLFQLENKRREASTAIDNMKGKVEAEFYIISEDSPVDEKKMRDLGVLYGVPFADSMEEDPDLKTPDGKPKMRYLLSLDEVKVGLQQSLASQARNDITAYSKFLQKVKGAKGAKTETLSLIRKLMTSGVIKLRNQGVVSVWHYVEGLPGTKRGDDILKCRVEDNTEDKKMTALALFLDKDDELRDLLEVKLQEKLNAATTKEVATQE